MYFGVDTFDIKYKSDSPTLKHISRIAYKDCNIARYFLLSCRMRMTIREMYGLLAVLAVFSPVLVEGTFSCDASMKLY